MQKLEGHTTGIIVGVRAAGAGAGVKAGELVPAGMYRAPPVKASSEKDSSSAILYEAHPNLHHRREKNGGQQTARPVLPAGHPAVPPSNDPPRPPK